MITINEKGNQKFQFLFILIWDLDDRQNVLVKTDWKFVLYIEKEVRNGMVMKEREAFKGFC